MNRITRYAVRIAFVSTILHYPWGGADKLWTRAAERAAKHGHTLLLALSSATAAHPRISALHQHGARIHLRRDFTVLNDAKKRWLERFRQAIGSSASLIVELSRFRPDFVYINQGGTFDFQVEPGLVAWLRKTSTPFAFICQANRADTQLDPPTAATSREVLGLARSIFFVSTHNLRLAERQIGAHLPLARIVQNPVEIPLHPLPWPTADSVRFAVVARLERHDKGLDLLIPALAAALGSDRDWHVAFYGRGPDEPFLRALAATHGIADRISFPGFQSDVRAVWQEHHLLLLPSRHEGCSLAMLEALACGRPVLATAVGGVSDWIVAGENGFVCDETDVAALTSTLRRAWSLRATWPQLGIGAARTAARLDPNPECALLAALPS